MDVDETARSAAHGMWNAALLGDRDLALRSCTAARNVLRAEVEYGLLVRLPWARTVGDPAITALRTACVCGHTHGVVRRLRGQDIVNCAACQAYQYCRAVSR